MCAGELFVAWPSTTSIHPSETTGASVDILKIIIWNEAHAAPPQAVHCFRFLVLLHCLAFWFSHDIACRPVRVPACGTCQKAPVIAHVWPTHCPWMVVVVVVACCCCFPYWLALMLALTFAPCILIFAPSACGVYLSINWCKHSTCTCGGCHQLQLVLVVPLFSH